MKPTLEEQVKLAGRERVSRLFLLDSRELRSLMLKPHPPQLTRSGESLGLDPYAELFQGYSDLKPHLYMLPGSTGALSTSVSYGLWVLIRELYLNHELDRADLNAWLEDEFPFTLRLITKRELLRLSTAKDALKILGTKGELLGLSAFHALA